MRKQDDEGQGIVEVAQGVREGWVALLDDVVQPILGLAVLLERLGCAPLASTNCARELLCKSLVLAELLEDRLVEEVLDVLYVVEGGRGRGSLVGLLVVLGLPGKDACAKRAN